MVLQEMGVLMKKVLPSHTHVSYDNIGCQFLREGYKNRCIVGQNQHIQSFCCQGCLQASVMRVGSDTFDDPIFQNGLQN